MNVSCRILHDKRFAMSGCMHVTCAAQYAMWPCTKTTSVLKDGFHTADTHAHTQNAEYVARRPAGNPARRHRIELDVVLKGTPF